VIVKEVMYLMLQNNTLLKLIYLESSIETLKDLISVRRLTPSHHKEGQYRFAPFYYCSLYLLSFMNFTESDLPTWCNQCRLLLLYTLARLASSLTEVDPLLPRKTQASRRDIPPRRDLPCKQGVRPHSLTRSNRLILSFLLSSC
jgi:hypothetical protein